MKESLRPTVWRTARALANVNRLKFLRAVFAAKGTKGIPETSLLRHLSLLIKGGVVALDDKRQYYVAKPKDALRSTLLKMATGS